VSETTRGELELRFGGNMQVRGFFLAIVGAALGDAPGVILEAAGNPPPSESMGWVLSGIFSIVALALPSYLRWARQPRGASVTWDERGITEWDGEAVRVAIPWERARARVRRWERGQAGSTPGRWWTVHLQVTDGSDRRIVVGTTIGIAARCRRRLIAPLKEIEKLESVLKDRGADERGRIDLSALDPHRPATGAGYWISVAAATVGYPGLVLGVITAGGEMGPPSTAAATVGLTLLLVRPLRELSSLLREGRRFAGAERVELVPGEHGLGVRDAGGRVRSVDTSDLDHPDAFLTERSGAAWLVADGDGGAGAPYREAPTRAAALESDASRQARRQRIRAVVLETSARAALASEAAALLVALTS